MYTQFNDNKKQKNQKQKNEAGFSTRVFRLILQKTGLESLLKRFVSDPRKGKCTYSLSSLLLCGLLVYFFRQESRNAFYDETKDSECFCNNIARTINATTVPSAKTVENAFISIQTDELASILPAIFNKLIRGKFFQLHPEFMLEEGRFILGIDAYITHIYYPHSQHPTSACPFCLQRTRGNAKWFLHMDVVLSIIGPHKFHFPLFLYRVKGNPDWGMVSDKKLKQECELSALPHLLEQLRNFFPKLKFSINLDSLYANCRIMELADKYGLEYIVVRKEGSLSSLNSEVEGLEKFESPFERTFAKGLWQVHQSAYVIQSLIHKGHPFQLIELKEESKKLPSKRFAKITNHLSHWQWIFNKEITSTNVFQRIDDARLRWLQEDEFNSLQKRGFAAEHDMSRSSNSQTVWKTLMFIAFTLSQLMKLSSLGIIARGTMAMRNWIKSIWAEFAKVSPEVLWSPPLPKQLRFYFNTS